MSHHYDICFIDQTGKFQGISAIQSVLRQYEIEDMLKEIPQVFEGGFYEIEDNYAAIEVKVAKESVEILCNQFYVDDPHAQEIADAVEYAIKKNYRLFLV
jgi:hypothetical protein